MSNDYENANRAYENLSEVEKYVFVQRYFEECGKDAHLINSEERVASKVFASAIEYAGQVFVNRLVLGGAYRSTENAEEILQILNRLNELITNNIQEK